MNAQAVQVPIVDVPEKKRGLGRLETLGPQKLVLPLSSVAIRARVADRIAEVDVEQKFHNALTEPLEAVYIFPLAGGAAVRKFELQIGSRVVRGRIEEREEARRQYQRALDEGKRAGLLEQERDDVFTVQIGNIVPGEELTVRMSYSERLPFFEDGRTELRLPLVVAPRFIPGDPTDKQQAGHGTAEDTDRVPDASRITPPRLAPGFDPKVALRVEAELFGSGVDDLACSQHATRLSAGPEATKVSLSRDDEPLDRDFVLRWRLAGEKVKTALLVHDGYALLSVVPPAREGFLGVPRDVVFVVDRSGSMAGAKLASAARACALLLRTLAPRDRFTVFAFENGVERMPGGFQVADEGAIEAGEKFLRQIEAGGGTALDLAMREAMGAIKGRGPSEGRVPVIVVLTDGEVGDESTILRAIQAELGDARVFTVGIDTAVNDGFLKRLAALGGGTSSFVEPSAGLEDALQAVAREIGTPLITGLRLEGDVGQLTPERFPDLFAGRAASVLFRGTGPVRVTGKHADGTTFSEHVQPREAPLAALAHLWARSRVTDLEDAFRASPSDELRREIVELSKKHTVLTRFTAFVAVDGEVVVKGQAPRTLVQPVAHPAQWTMGNMALGSMPAGRGPARQRGFTAKAQLGGFRATSIHELSQAVESAAPGASMFRAQPAPGRPLPPERPDRVRAALEALARAFEEARKDGKPEALEQARKELLEALQSAFELAATLPLLQRFLRGPLVELIAALKAAGGRDLFDQHAPALEAALAEARGEKPAAGRFWEASI